MFFSDGKGVELSSVLILCDKRNRHQTIALNFILAYVRRLIRLNFSNGSVEILWCLLFGLCQIAVHPSNNAKRNSHHGERKTACGFSVAIAFAFGDALNWRLRIDWSGFNIATKQREKLCCVLSIGGTTATQLQHINESSHQNTIIT